MDIEELYKLKHCLKEDKRFWQAKLNKYNKAVEKFGYFPFLNYEDIKLLGINLEDTEMKIYGYWARSLVSNGCDLKHPDFLEYKDAFIKRDRMWLQEGYTYVDMEKYLEERKKKMKDIDIENINKVKNGEDILIRFPGEGGYHYEEKDWKELNNEQRIKVIEWIREKFTPIKRINRNHSSYGIKHWCESDLGFYVSNNVIKKALILEGYKCDTSRINWFFNISEKCFKRR